MDASDQHAECLLWRAVEAQHVASTMQLVDTLEEQRLLEELLDEAKPAVPAEAMHLHYLLATPFRYPSPIGSRFRRVTDPGVLYGADEVRTACAELGYWRWRFLVDSPSLASIDAMPQTLFRFGASGQGRDLRVAPWEARANEWRHPSDYTACQVLGDDARQSGVELIRYVSARDPLRGSCGAVLTPVAIAPRVPLSRESWYLQVHRERVRWWRSEGARNDEGYDFDSAAWMPSMAL